MKILVLGATGLIGSEVYRYLSKKNNVYGTYNDKDKIKKIQYNKKKIFYLDALNKKNFIKVIDKVKPDIVINCIGVTKHIMKVSKNKILTINGDFPHFAKRVSNLKLSKFVQVSTDCVFDGYKGNYNESSIPNAQDFYGKSKAAGEINDKINLTVRTSTIGREILTKHGLLEWFLSQKSSCYGYSKAIFNGYPTFYFVKILEKLIKKNVTGLVNISGNKINKYTLLNKIKKIYKKKIVIKKNTSIKINRSLDNRLLNKYLPKLEKNWDKLLKKMKNEYRKNPLKD